MKPTIFIPSALAKLLIPVTPPSEFLPDIAEIAVGGSAETSQVESCRRRVNQSVCDRSRIVLSSHHRPIAGSGRGHAYDFSGLDRCGDGESDRMWI